MNEKLKEFKYQIIGEDSSPKLIFLHGMMGRGKNWQSIAKNFSKSFQCLIYDQRGHGESMKPKSGYSLEDYAQDLKEILDGLGWSEPIYLVGHSMGGRVSLFFADRYPELVKKLVIVDIGPTSDWDSMLSIQEKMNFVPVPFATRQEARSFMENEFLGKYKNKMVMEFFYSNLVKSGDVYDWVFSPSAITQTLEFSRLADYWSEFKSLSMQTLLIRGGLSSDLTQEDFEKVVANNSNISGKVVEGAGHWVHAEKPLETIGIIRDFFNIDGSPQR
mgnify:CR=1 FL=1